MRLCVSTKLFFLVVSGLSAYLNVAWANPSQPSSTPPWVTRLSKADDGGYRHFVGCAEGITELQDGLRKAQINALENIATKEFPELLTVRISGKESIKKDETHVDQTYVSRFEKIRWNGLLIADEFYQFNDGMGKVCKLLKWHTSLIEIERNRIAQEEKQASTASNVSAAPIGYINKLIGSLKVITTPVGADILLNSEHIGRSNAYFKRVGQGEYELKAYLDGYESITRKVTVEQGADTTVRLDLEKTKCDLHIESTPSNATVYLNNVPVGQTPIQLKVTKGEHQVKVELPDYYTDQRNLVVDEAGSEEKISLKIKPSLISVISIPSGASIFVDGKFVGKTPKMNISVPGGSRQIKLTREKFEEHIETINVSESIRRTVDAKLTPISQKERLEQEQTKREQSLKEQQERETAREAQKQSGLYETDKNKYFDKYCENGVIGTYCGDISADRLQRKAKLLTGFKTFGIYSLGLASITTAMLWANESNSADEIYKKYQAATTAEDAKAYRSQAEAHDEKAKNFAIISLLAGLGWAILYGSSDDKIASNLTTDSKSVAFNFNLRF